MHIQNKILAEFCSEIPVANGQTTVLQLMDVSSGPQSAFETTFRQRFSLPIDPGHDQIHTRDSGDITPSHITNSVVPTSNDNQYPQPSTITTRSDNLSNGEDHILNVSSTDLAEDISLVDDIISNNAPLSTEHAAERSVYLKRFVRKTSTLTYGWFETTGAQPVDTPPNFLSFDTLQLGDLFLHRTDQKVSCWIREYSPSGGVWRVILPGDNGSHNEDFSCRILVLHSDGNPTWVLPKTYGFIGALNRDLRRFKTPRPHNNQDNRRTTLGSWYGFIGALNRDLRRFKTPRPHNNHQDSRRTTLGSWVNQSGDLRRFQSPRPQYGFIDVLSRDLRRFKTPRPHNNHQDSRRTTLGSRYGFIGVQTPHPHATNQRRLKYNDNWITSPADAVNVLKGQLALMHPTEGIHSFLQESEGTAEVLILAQLLVNVDVELRKSGFNSEYHVINYPREKILKLPPGAFPPSSTWADTVDKGLLRMLIHLPIPFVVFTLPSLLFTYHSWTNVLSAILTMQQLSPLAWACALRVPITTCLSISIYLCNTGVHYLFYYHFIIPMELEGVKSAVGKCQKLSNNLKLCTAIKNQRND
ncbi:uncharacterized protein F5891DRAFT_990773 [Suillus fuscotomentosus]|uniref:Uncharacterized protein n=1 Tax=Suillus fuscotomentosus TaxID=1912939 RepID=A0AAD4DMP6_9AGAM|nr:uncharacterized protein F5891DRAFT_990773 [Suillus fuscotomentosus]KAG1883527.1 hypothetical protein F5891DRAFT_990773 [Suillus fuscotomentosus]